MISISQKLNQSFDKKGQTDGNKYSADYNNVELNLVKPRSLWAMGGWVCFKRSPLTLCCSGMYTFSRCREQRLSIIGGGGSKA